jgi:xylulokinase
VLTGSGRRAVSGAFLGIDLRHTSNDMIRAVLEGIAFDLCIMYHKLAQLVELEELILMVGGGSNSPDWRQMFADVFNRPFARANVGQDAASLGAAAVAAVGSGLWDDFRQVGDLIQYVEIARPDQAAVTRYQTVLSVYEQTWAHLSDIAELMKRID